MPLLSLEQLDGLLVCPVCHGSLSGSTLIRCFGCRRKYPAMTQEGRWPVLIDSSRSVVDVAAVVKSGAVSHVNRHRGGRLLSPLRRVSHPLNRTAELCLARLMRDVGLVGGQGRVLVVGGGAVGAGIEALYTSSDIDVLSFDIYASPNVQFLADAHSIPLPEESVDAVVVQAVLEHVLEKHVVVAEIYRVLRPGGVVYADTPFMQQVHEGAYDFTRFTESGHRYLFRSFEEIERGAVAGPGTALRWSLDYFARALFRSNAAGRIVRLLFMWLSWLDPALSRAGSVDGASSVYFYGRRASVVLAPHAVISGYRGAQR